MYLMYIYLYIYKIYFTKAHINISPVFLCGGHTKNKTGEMFIPHVKRVKLWHIGSGNVMLKI